MTESTETHAFTSAQPAPEDAASIAGKRSGPGILMLALPLRVLHMNRRAWELIKQMSHDEHAKRAHGLLPSPLTELCAEIQKTLRTRTATKDWEQFEVRQLAGDSTHPVLLRGFGLPGSGRVQHSRIFIIMEEGGRRSQSPNGRVPDRFQLTVRAQAVIEHLAKGLTNKEIAVSLGISEPTVKAHIRHIMEKTKSSTRTGILAQVLHQ